MAGDEPSGVPPLGVAGIAEAVLAAAPNAGVGIMVIEVSPAVRTLYASEYAAELMGVSREELVRVDPMTLLAQDSLEPLNELIDQRRRGTPGPATFEVRVRRSDGAEAFLLVGVGRVEIDGRPCSVALLRDASERERARAERLGSEARLRAIIESAPDGIVISRERRIVYANHAAAALLGYAHPDQMREASFGDHLHPEDFRRMAERIGMLKMGGAPIGPHEYRARAKDGRAVVVEVTSMLIDVGDGPVVLGFARDVTEARRLQAQLVRADRLAALGTLAAGMAHEINNPLAFMMLGLDAIERQLDRGGGDAAIRATVADVRHGVERIAAIVRDLRLFSRSDEAPRRGAADLRAVLEASVRMVEHEVRSQGQLIARYGDLPPVRGEGTQLEQIFLNLLLNSAQALVPAQRPGRIELDARQVGDRVVVTVRDNGAGIAPEHLAHVFDPFFTTKPVGAGTGLGLSIVHSIVTEIGGEIAIESELDAGTLVRISLLLARRMPSTPPEARRDKLSKGPLRVLIVDDEPVFARTLQQLLAQEGHDVTAASDIETAVASLRSGGPDFVLLDLMLPGTSGIEFFERIAADDPALARRVVFTTGGHAREAVQRFLASARNPVLRKPFPIERLLALMGRR